MDYDELAVDQIRQLSRDGAEEAAIDLATSVAAASRTPTIVATALILKLGSLLNIGRNEEWAAELDHAFSAARRTGDHALMGGFHAVAGAIVGQRSLERSLRHLLLGVRELEQVRQAAPQVLDSWHNLAVSFSYAGFHAQATAVAEHADRTARAIALPHGDYALLEVPVRRAIALDHDGDSDGCVRLLRQTVCSTRFDPALLRYSQRCYYDYAVARLRALGEDPSVPTAEIAAGYPGWEAADLRLLCAAATDIADGRPAEALRRLADARINPHTVGPAELFRLRSLAHSAAGDFRAALRAERAATRLAGEGRDTMHDRLVDATRNQLDHEALRRTVQQYASQALTDSLTGLPNRRHFDQRVGQVAERRIPSCVGIIDLDDFKAINTAYGHLAGDLVLQRVAAILARTVRRGDFVARYGGDEFVAVLPRTDLDTAHDVGHRIAEAVANGGWDALVSGSRVSVTIGWAELTDPGQLMAALRSADRAMFAQKARRHDIPLIG